MGFRSDPSEKIGFAVSSDTTQLDQTPYINKAPQRTHSLKKYTNE